MDADPIRLLMVCSGNICRSPMAAGLGRALAEPLGLDVEVASAGTLGIVGQPADPKATAVCREIGIDVSGHVSQGVTPELLAWADHVLVMELEHAVFVRSLAPDLGEDKVVLLGSLTGSGDIADPIGSWFKGPFRAARDEIRKALVAFLTRLAG